MVGKKRLLKPTALILPLSCQLAWKFIANLPWSFLAALLFSLAFVLLTSLSPFFATELWLANFLGKDEILSIKSTIGSQCFAKS